MRNLLFVLCGLFQMAALDMRRCACCKFQNNGENSEGLIKIQRIEVKTVLMKSGCQNEFIG